MRSSDKAGTNTRQKPRQSAQKPSQEIEIKLRVADRCALLARLSELGAVYQGRVYERNTLYDTSERSLMRKGQLLRIRTERQADRPGMQAPRGHAKPEGALLTFKGPVRRPGVPAARSDRRYKVREEREVRFADGDDLAVILESLGLRPSFRYEKYRSTYRLPKLNGVTLELDETPVGDFLEAEGDRAAIDRAASLLGYAPRDYVTKSYWDLFQDNMRKRLHPNSRKRGRVRRLTHGDMLFPRGQ